MNKIALAVAMTIALAGMANAEQKAAAPAAAPATAPGKHMKREAAQKLEEVIAGSWRSDANKARDKYRHPQKTLMFFGIRSDQTLIEISPGGGWYTEILAPFLNGSGTYIAANAKPRNADGEAARDKSGLRAKFAADAAHYGEAKVIEYDSKAPNLGAPNSADMVVTFRNVHNWVMDDTAPVMFKAFFDVLKPGGVLGITDHRAAPGADLAKIKQSGYLPEDYVIKLATDAGFKLEKKSEINANPKDTKDYAKGVWTLPPSLQLGDKDREKYLAIGESDRMTLKFVKPMADQIFTPPAEKSGK